MNLQELNTGATRVGNTMIEYTVNVGKTITKWYLNGILHREDGPAVEWASGNKYWYLNGQLHREDGPACELVNGSKQWFLNGRHYSEEDFIKATNPVKELSIAEIEKLLGYQIKVVK